ncbi:hypothetical protein KY366_00615, partial [Candidatus Woesearchaeota archaeon]|nr:hypothetical protein [Candidatus Woesearchaeota archaeon]
LNNMFPDLVQKTDFRVVVSSGIYTIKFTGKMKELWDKINYWGMIFEVIKGKFSSDIAEKIFFMEKQESDFDYSHSNSRNFPMNNFIWAKRNSTPMYEISFKESKAK